MEYNILTFKTRPVLNQSIVFMQASMYLIAKKQQAFQSCRMLDRRFFSDVWLMAAHTLSSLVTPGVTWSQ